MLNLVLLALMMWAWMPRAASHVGIEADGSLRLVSSPIGDLRQGLARLAGSSPATEGSELVDEYGALQVPLREPQYRVCVADTAVKTNPGEQFPVVYRLLSGDKVEILERSHGTLGWARIAMGVLLYEAPGYPMVPGRNVPAWVWEMDLCRGAP